jgi:hypothetical protein
VRSRSKNDIRVQLKLNNMDSLGTRISATVAVAVGWLVFVVLYLAFFATSFDFWQKFAIFIASGAIVLGVVVIIWIRWLMK